MAALLAVVAAAGPSAGAAHAQPASDPPYQLPPPTLTIVSTLEMPRPQPLRTVLDDGMRLLVRAYKPVRLSVSLALTPQTARRVKLRGSRTVAGRSYDFTKPGYYHPRLRLAHRAVTRLARVHRATFLLEAVLQGPTGSARSASRITLHD